MGRPRKNAKKKTVAKKTATATTSTLNQGADSIETRQDKKVAETQTDTMPVPIQETGINGETLNRRDPATLRPTGTEGGNYVPKPLPVEHPEHPNSNVSDIVDDVKPESGTDFDITNVGESKPSQETGRGDIDSQMAGAVELDIISDDESAYEYGDLITAFNRVLESLSPSITCSLLQCSVKTVQPASYLFVPLAKGGRLGAVFQFEAIGDEHPGSAARRQKKSSQYLISMEKSGYYVAVCHGVEDAVSQLTRYLTFDDTALSGVF